jgi:hypothetical protein
VLELLEVEASMRFTVGGRHLELSREEVERGVQGKEPEEIRTYRVLVGSDSFPPKQVLAAATGWSRQSFTSHEATRVLARLGFECLRSDGSGDDGTLASPASTDDDPNWRVALEPVQAAIEVLQAAVAGLSQRVSRLEAR